jgi:acetylornithine deacetylase/succinyl-diaminopimelate desuccinylase-like protein
VALSGKLKDGYIYSRGAMDFKNGVMGILEALEHLLSNGFKPSRTFYISIGCDGKNRGCKGATQDSFERILYKFDHFCEFTDTLFC